MTKLDLSTVDPCLPFRELGLPEEGAHATVTHAIAEWNGMRVKVLEVTATIRVEDEQGRTWKFPAECVVPDGGEG